MNAQLSIDGGEGRLVDSFKVMLLARFGDTAAR
jgi:hypothetical protein